MEFSMDGCRIWLLTYGCRWWLHGSVLALESVNSQKQGVPSTLQAVDVECHPVHAGARVSGRPDLPRGPLRVFLALRPDGRRMRPVDGTRGVARHGAGPLPGNLSCRRHARAYARRACPIAACPVGFALSSPCFPATIDPANLHTPNPNPNA